MGRRTGEVVGPRVEREGLAAFSGSSLEDDDEVDGVLWEDGMPDGASDVVVSSSVLEGVGLTGVALERLSLVDVLVERAEMSGCDVSEGRFERVRFSGCRMAGLVATGMRARHVRFDDCALGDGWLRGAVLEHVRFVGCDLTGADLYGARLSDVRFLRCSLDGVELSDVSCDAVALHGSSLDGVRGVAGLSGGVTIASDQVLSLALPLLAARGIVVDDELDD